jgi:Tfp pilus assembly protein PilN
MCYQKQVEEKLAQVIELIYEHYDTRIEMSKIVEWLTVLVPEEIYVDYILSTSQEELMEYIYE